MAVTLTQLNAFLAVVRHGSVTAAAQELFVTQPGLPAAGADAAGRAAAEAQRRLRLAAVLTAGEFLMPALIQSFREHRPDLDVSLGVANRREVFRSLAAHEVDVVVSGR